MPAITCTTSACNPSIYSYRSNQSIFHVEMCSNVFFIVTLAIFSHFHGFNIFHVLGANHLIFSSFLSKVKRTWTNSMLRSPLRHPKYSNNICLYIIRREFVNKTVKLAEYRHSHKFWLKVRTENIGIYVENCYKNIKSFL